MILKNAFGAGKRTMEMFHNGLFKAREDVLTYFNYVFFFLLCDLINVIRN